MSREEYLKQLQKYLRRLPKEDYENAIEYFHEYFEEAGEENEQKVMEELGSPQEAAAELLSNLLREKTSREASGEKRKNSAGTILLITALAIFAAPVGAPFFAAVMVCFLIGVLMIALTVFITAVLSIATVVAGIKLLLRGFVAIPVSVSGASLIIGTGLLAVGAGICLSILVIYLCKWVAYGIGRVGERMIRRNKKEGIANE